MTAISMVPLDRSTFKKHRKLYLIALFSIAITIIVGQVFIQKNLKNQLSDSKIINISGRQRMLSQKLVKELLILNNLKDKNSEILQIQKIKKTLYLFESSQLAIEFGNDSLIFPKNKSAKLISMYANIRPTFLSFVTASKKFIENKDQTYLNQTEQYEVIFLKKMNQIVVQYDYEAKEKVTLQSKINYFILTFTLILLLLEFIFIFRPIAIQVQKLIFKLLDSEKKAVKIAQDTLILSEIKENSVKELKSLNSILDNTLLYCRVSVDGTLIHLGQRFSKLIENNNFVGDKKFYEVLTQVEKEKIQLSKLISNHNKRGWQGEVSFTHQSGKIIWLDMSLVPVIIKEDTSEILIICFDITERKLAEEEVERLNQENIKDKLDQQKIISSKIVENQENEQNRIAREIHDGIGQMLTGLKLSLESIDVKDKEKSTQKIEYLKKLTLDIINAVRTATFNLMPPELSDYGIVSSLTKLSQVLTKLTGKEIQIYNKTNFNERLDSLIEINLYRVVQEAINNAIKYAESSHIIIQISHNQEMLSIIIDDNGLGFDMKSVKVKENKESGMGLQFMKQRIQYINGRIFINSIKNQGTRITINLPIKSQLHI